MIKNYTKQDVLNEINWLKKEIANCGDEYLKRGLELLEKEYSAFN